LFYHISNIPNRQKKEQGKKNKRNEMNEITEWPGLKRTTVLISFQPHCYVQGRQPAAQAAQSHIQPGLECLQGWGIHSLLGQPVQCITTQWVKNFPVRLWAMLCQWLSRNLLEVCAAGGRLQRSCLDGASAHSLAETQQD